MTQTTQTTFKDPHSKEWHRRRSVGLGGGDSAILILGESHPFSNPYELWKRKMGMIPPPEINAPMQRGMTLEPIVIDMFKERTGYRISQKGQFIKSKKFPWMLGNVDAWYETEKGRGILEVKCPGMRTFLRCKQEGPQAYYMIQVQHYLGVSELEFATIAIFNAELWEMITFDIEFDPEFFDILVKNGRKFWDYVEAGTPPLDFMEEREEIEIPKVELNPEIVKIDTEGWKDATEIYKLAYDLRKEAEELEKDAKSRISNIMELEGLEVAEGSGLRVYWRYSKPRVTFDHKSFAYAHPEMDLSPWYKTGKASRVFRPYFLKEEAENLEKLYEGEE